MEASKDMGPMARRWWSRDSLVTRMTIMIVAMGLLSLVLHFVLMGAFVMGESKELVSGLVAAVRHERALLALTDPGRREALAAELTRPNHRVFRGEADAANEIDEEDFAARKLLQLLRSEAGPPFRITLSSKQDEVAQRVARFSFDVAGERWHVEHDPGSPLLSALGSLLGWLAMIATAVLVSSVTGVRLVGRPLSQLAAQLRRQPGTLKQLELPSGASAEIRGLVAAFNQLVTANARAEATKQQMLAGVSHDLRTPLSRLRFRVETQCAPEVATELVFDLKALERIVSQFLGYVQGENHAGLGEPWPLNDLVRTIVGFYALQGRMVVAQDSEITFRVPDLAVQRVLTNLIDNALDYGTEPVEVELFQDRDPDGRHVGLTVWDCGKGMSAAEFERAKQPFARLSGADKASGHCGLGLAIVDQVVQHTGGVLRLDRDRTGGRFGITIVWTASA